MRPRRLERPTFGFGDQRSIQTELRARSFVVTHFAEMLQWSPSAIGFSDLSPGVSFKRVRESLLPYSR